MGRRESDRLRLLAWGGALIATLAAGELLNGCSRSLGAVEQIEATPQAASVALTWHPVAGATAYDVYLSTASTISPSSYQIMDTTTGTSDTIAGLSSGATYYCIVVATSSDGLAQGPYDAVITVTIAGSGSASNPTPIIASLTVWPEPVPLTGSALFVVTASDSDGDTLSYSWTLNGASLSATTNQLVWTPPAGTASGSSYTLSVSVSDGVNPPVTAQTSFLVQ